MSFFVIYNSQSPPLGSPVKGSVENCNGENILVSLRFPKLRRRVKTISIYDPGHKDDIKPSNSRSDVDKPLASNVNVRKLRKMYREHKVNVYE